MAHDPHPLKHLLPGWYAIVMGLCGLSLAWYRATPLMGDMAGLLAIGIGGLAAAVFVVLAVATLMRAQRHPDAWAEDRRHPVRHTFIAALPIAVILLATVAVALGVPLGWVRPLWWAGSLSQLFVTVWVLARWFNGNKPGGLQWASATPALFIPIVGNVLVPLAGVPLGHADWAAAQFGIGVMFWPLVMALIVARIAINGMWPDRMLPTTFIFIAPPAVVGLSALQLGAPPMLAWMLWGMALFTLLWVATLAPRIGKMPFGLPHWGMSFPLAAFAALTLRLATPGSALAVLGPALLALATLVILLLVLGTVRGLRDGSLLAPEPVAAIVPVAGS
ncbi:SLAC1 anion channel family protein [Ideonella sp. A 288]|uniref:SLAC1 anion channel family protein n=1 Tax=Ideonella sp. A 288 TaxID=1962181 RepID=UPI000B4C07A6|nr:SLAC1 anion channel family protein [Ideonella sp. A 288]